MLIDLINLDSRPDRYQKFIAHSPPGYTVRRVSARTPEQLDLATLHAQGRLHDPHAAYTPVAIAQCISHLNAWHRIQRENRLTIICEDDVIFRKDAKEHIEWALDDLPDDWDLVAFGVNHCAMAQIARPAGHLQHRIQFCLQQQPDWQPKFRKDKPEPDLWRLIAASATICYTIKPASVAKIVKATFPIRDGLISLPDNPGTWKYDGIDTLMCDAYPDLSAWLLWPPIAMTDDEKHRQPAS
jgi:Glycosyltransferase family 25 (LPS biosynthesis protein)